MLKHFVIREPAAPSPILAPQPARCRRITSAALVFIWVFSLLSVVAPVGVARASGLRTYPISISVRVARSVVSGGKTQTLIETVRSGRSIKGAIVDLEVYDHVGRKVFQATKPVSLAAQRRLTVVVRYRLPPRPSGGAYRVKAGVFGSHWKPMYAWADAAGRFAVIGSAPIEITPTARVDPRPIWPGNTKLITANVAVSYARLSRALVDIEVYNGVSKVCQAVKKGLTVPAGHVVHVTALCWIAANQTRGTYLVRVGVFSDDWHTLYSWNFHAAAFQVK